MPHALSLSSRIHQERGCCIGELGGVDAEDVKYMPDAVAAKGVSPGTPTGCMDAYAKAS